MPKNTESESQIWDGKDEKEEGTGNAAPLSKPPAILEKATYSPSESTRDRKSVTAPGDI